MFSSIGESLFIMPVCYHPTTVLSIDDDKSFSDMLQIAVSDKISILCFDQTQKAMKYIKKGHRYFPFTERCLIRNGDSSELNLMAIRHEIYNKDRFKAIFMSVTDYELLLFS